MKNTQFNQELLQFLGASPTPFHAVEAMAEPLLSAGFERLNEAEHWVLVPGSRYFVTRNDSSIIAFTMGYGDVAESGFRMTGAHTDSPCLKVKPQPEIVKYGYYQLGVEVYGGVLLNPWFDRDLSMAGRVSYLTDQGVLESALIDFKYPVAMIPSLAIHLDRNANKERTVNPQKDLPPLLFLSEKGNQPDFHDLLLQQLLEQHSSIEAEKVLDYEISLYDTQPPALIGFHQEFIASARLDNLLSCFTLMKSLIESEADHQHFNLMVCSDHEEVGSASACGAQGPFLESVLSRICDTQECMLRALDRSVMVSVDNAHAMHPNFAEKYDANHGPILNEGPVIKVNANQRYASNSETAALFRYLCEQQQVPVQSFVVRSDMGCGSTIGPITASGIGVKTVDVGVPTFAMHSIRELAGHRDAFSLHQVLQGFYHLNE
ncbi:MAG: M18 family aminopeptidase [Gammaproteobacteria bacterium]|nr:M18 family aminopeptidase [Gammaproteobacteria bacterium]